MKLLALAALIALLIVGSAAAQDAPPTEIPPVVRFTPTSPAPPLEGTPSLRPIIPDPNDARLAACAASTLEGFAPYIVRPGDRLDVLLAGYSMISVTQLAALNCLDDPYALPVGAAIWLPRSVSVFTASSVSATAEPAARAAIQQFEADARDNMQGVTITWAAEGDAAYLYPCADAATCARPHTAHPVPLEGTLRLYPFTYAGDYTYRLEVEGGGETVTQDAVFTIACAQGWLGGMTMRQCPDQPPLAVMIAYQSFERGAMIWFSDTLEIYVLTDDGRVRIYEDVFREGAPDPAAVAPEGLRTPVRGFGMIWELLGGAQSPLGWATAPESGFDSARQAAGRTSYTTYILVPGNAVYAVTLIPGMEQGYWAKTASQAGL